MKQWRVERLVVMDVKNIKIILVENHPIVREGLRSSIESDVEYSVVAEAGDGQAAIFACDKHEHDVLIINSILPGTDTYHAISTIKKRTKNKIIVTTIDEDSNVLRDLRECGVDGFIGKDAASSEYLVAIKAVCIGGLYFSQNMADVIFQVARATNDKRNAYGLTSRELEILSLLSSGYCNKEVANKYDLSVRTVEAHRLNIRRKTQSNTLSDLVRISRSLGLANMAGNIRDENSANLYGGHTL